MRTPTRRTSCGAVGGLPLQCEGYDRGEMGTMIYKSNQGIAPHCSIIV
jgi:hypothetical protein